MTAEDYEDERDVTLGVRPIGGTKVCPRCGEELFEDMDVCYGCLYDFSRAREKSQEVVVADDIEDDLDEPDDLDAVDMGMEPPWDEGLPPSFVEDLDATLPLTLPATRLPRAERDSLWVRSPDMEVVVPVGESGLCVGRAGSCDVVLHSIAVSRRHLGFELSGGGMIARNLGARNPATVGGREVLDSCVLQPGQTVNVCGTLFTYLRA